MTPLPQDLVARLIWSTIDTRGSLTRSQLEAITGLPKSTVTEHVRAMLRQHVLEEVTPDAAGSRGRPARVLSIVDSGPLRGVVVMSHAAEHVQGPVRVAFGSSRGFIRWTRTADAAGDPMGVAIDLVQNGRAELGGPEIAGILLVLPLPVIRQKGSDGGLPRLQVIPSMPDPIGLTPQDVLSAELHLPVAIANDADMAALGEGRFGVGSGIADLVYMKTMRGVGMGIVIGGNLIEPAGVPVGELAHLRRAGSEGRCICGSVGCWFTDISEGLGLISMVRKFGVAVSSWTDLESRCAAADPAVRAALVQAGEHIGAAFAQFAMLSGHFTVILEDGLRATHEPVAEGLTSALTGSAPDWSSDDIPIRRGVLGDDAEVLGGFEYMRIHPVDQPAGPIGRQRTSAPLDDRERAGRS